MIPKKGDWIFQRDKGDGQWFIDKVTMIENKDRTGKICKTRVIHTNDPEIMGCTDSFFLGDFDNNYGLGDDNYITRILDEDDKNLFRMLFVV